MPINVSEKLDFWKLFFTYFTLGLLRQRQNWCLEDWSSLWSTNFTSQYVCYGVLRLKRRLFKKFLLVIALYHIFYKSRCKISQLQCLSSWLLKLTYTSRNRLLEFLGWIDWGTNFRDSAFECRFKKLPRHLSLRLFRSRFRQILCEISRFVFCHIKVKLINQKAIQLLSFIGTSQF